jgi:hypothetical protein
MFISSEEPSPGLYQKFWVTRTDGSSEEGRRHAGCAYLVLDWEHDPFAPAAGRAYADACEESHPDLAMDVRTLAAKHAKRWEK